MSCYILKEKQNGQQQQPVAIQLREDEVIVGRIHSSLKGFIRVSKRHAKFQRGSKGEIFLKDLGSRNGLYVNCRKIGSALCELKAGDQIGFGSPDVRADNKSFICILYKKVNLENEYDYSNNICTTSLASLDSGISAVMSGSETEKEDINRDISLNITDHFTGSTSLQSATAVRHCQCIQVEGANSEKNFPNLNYPAALLSNSTRRKLTFEQCKSSSFERSGVLSDSSTDEEMGIQQTSTYRQVCRKNKKVIFDEVSNDEESHKSRLTFERLKKIEKTTEPSTECSPKSLNLNYKIISDVKSDHNPTDDNIVHKTHSLTENISPIDCDNFSSDSEHSEASIELEDKVIIPSCFKASTVKTNLPGKRCVNFRFESDHSDASIEASPTNTNMPGEDEFQNSNPEAAYVSEWTSKQCINNKISENQKLSTLSCNPEAEKSSASLNSLEKGNEHCSKQDDLCNLDIDSLKSCDRVTCPSGSFESRKTLYEEQDVNGRETDIKSSHIVIENRTLNSNEQIHSTSRIKPATNSKLYSEMESGKMRTHMQAEKSDSERKSSQFKRKMHDINERKENDPRAAKVTKINGRKVKKNSPTEVSHGKRNAAKFPSRCRMDGLNLKSSKSLQDPMKDSGFHEQSILQTNYGLSSTKSTVSKIFQQRQTENMSVSMLPSDQSMNPRYFELSGVTAQTDSALYSDIADRNNTASLHCEPSPENTTVTINSQITATSEASYSFCYGNVEYLNYKSVQNTNYSESYPVLSYCGSLQDNYPKTTDVSEIISQSNQHLHNLHTTQIGKSEKQKSAHCDNSKKEYLSHNILKPSPEIEQLSEMESTSFRSSRASKRTQSCESRFLENNVKKDLHYEHSMNSKETLTKPYDKKKELNIINDLIRTIVGWNCMWLKEQRRNPNLPKAISRYICNLPLKFKSFDTYLYSFSSMLTLEIWEILCQGSKSIIETDFQKNKCELCILESCKENDIVIFTCELFVNGIDTHCPQNGTIIFLPRLQSGSYGLGYVFKRQRAENHSSICMSEWRRRSSLQLDNSELWNIKICGNRSLIALPEKKLIEANIVCTLYDKIALYDCIQELESSIFLKDILTPTHKTFFTDPVPIQASTRENGDCSLCQRLIIQRIVSDITKLPQVPRISLLEGSPGTGKTYIIIRILENLIFGRKLDKKVLLIAPSSAALDQINRCIIQTNELNSLRNIKLKFERIGSASEMYGALRAFCPEKADVYNSGMINNFTELNSHKRIPYSDEDIDPSKYHENVKGKYSEIKNWNYHDIIEHKISKNTDIVLSTLSDFMKIMSVPRLKDMFTKQFSVCIIDESTQCTEPEMLGPFILNITKIILVGDHKELAPSVYSRHAIRCGFGRSLFERFKDNFALLPSEYPVHTLTEQFRMHPQISNFPSRQFYDGRLVSAPVIEMKYETCCLRPYTVVDVISSSVPAAHEQGALLIASFCSEAVKATPGSSVGIITPDEHQKTLCHQALPENLRFVKVDTVDKFQGEERDIVIISCFTSSQSFKKSFFGDRKKLNIAVTRARLCLIMVGQISSLMIQDDWKFLVSNAKAKENFVRVLHNEDVKLVFQKHVFKQSKISFL